MSFYQQKHNRISAKIISIALIHAFLFTGILYPDSINSFNNKDIASIYVPKMKLRVPMANSKEKKGDFATSFLQILSPKERISESEENVFTFPVIDFNTRCDRKGFKHYGPKKMFLMKFADIPSRRKNYVLNTIRQWSVLDDGIYGEKSKTMFGLWGTMPGYKLLSSYDEEEFLSAVYFIFDSKGVLTGMVDCLQVNISRDIEGLLFLPKGICLNEIVVNPEFREKKYPRQEIIYPELEKDIFLLVLKEAVDRGLSFNIATWGNLRQAEGIKNLLGYYMVIYESKKPDYIEISAAQAKDLYAKIVVSDMVDKGPKIRIVPDKRKGRTDI